MVSHIKAKSVHAEKVPSFERCLLCISGFCLLTRFDGHLHICSAEVLKALGGNRASVRS